MTTSGANGAALAAGPAAGTQPATAPSTDRVPSFDIIRVEPSGDSVIAARGAPNAEIDLLDGGTAIAHAKADASGQVAFLPPALKAGEHNLMLSMRTPGGGQAVSSQSVAVSIPAEPKTAPMVALIQPNQPAAILSGPVAGSGTATPLPPPPVGGPAAAIGSNSTVSPAGPVAIRSVEVESMGSFYAAGHAPPGSKSRVYLNDAYVATVTAGPGGNWSLRINRGMKAGHYEVRADQIEPDGKVVSRAQVPFDYPVQVASASAGMDAAKKKSEGPSSVATAPSPTGSVAGASPGQGGATNSAPAGAAGGAAPGAAETKAGPAGAPAPQGHGGVDGGNGAAGSALAALGGTDRIGAETQAGAATQSAAVPEAGGKPLPTVTPGSPGGKPPGDGAPSGSDDSASTGGKPAADAGAGARSIGSTPAGGSPPRAAAPQTQPASTATSTQLQPQGEAAKQANASASQNPTSDGQPQDATKPGQGALSVAVEDDSPTVIEELVTAKVVHGDSLWRISRHMLGHGIRYTQIYAANTEQIRDPRLIFPGQVFVLPQD